MSITAPVMRYHGGKFRLASWVMQYFPPHNCYVESFGGAAGVLMQKPRSYAEVYNDLDGEVVNVFRVLRDDEMRERLIQLCVMTPFSRDEFEASYVEDDDPVEQARRTLFRAEAGFGSGGSTGHNTGFRADSKRAYSLASHIWSRYPERISAFGERLRDVIIENRPAVKVIKATDGHDVLHYVDPPYVLDTRVLSRGHVYRHEMNDEQHIELLETLKKVDGYVVLSGYHSELYDDILSRWECHETEARISSGKGTGKRTECVWLNKQCSEQQNQLPLMIESSREEAA